MSKAKHTQGKWDIRYGTPDPENDNCFHNSIEVDGRNIADVWASDSHICKTPAECNANARLIAEAPTLLSELEVSTSIMESVLHLFGESMAMSTKFGLTSQIESNKELIKKIEG